MILLADPAGTPQNLNFPLYFLEISRFCSFVVYLGMIFSKIVKNLGAGGPKPKMKVFRHSSVRGCDELPSALYDSLLF